MKFKLGVLLFLLTAVTQSAAASTVADFSSVSFNGCKPARDLSKIEQNKPVYFDCSIKNDGDKEVAVFLRKSQMNGKVDVSHSVELYRINPHTSTTTRTIFFSTQEVGRKLFLISVVGAIDVGNNDFKEGVVIGREYSYDGNLVGDGVVLDDIEINKTDYTIGIRGLMNVRIADQTTKSILDKPVTITIATVDDKGSVCQEPIQSETFLEKVKDLDYYVYLNDGCKNIKSLSATVTSASGVNIGGKNFEISFDNSNSGNVGSDKYFGLVTLKQVMILLLIFVAVVWYRYSRFKDQDQITQQ